MEDLKEIESENQKAGFILDMLALGAERFRKAEEERKSSQRAPDLVVESEVERMCEVFDKLHAFSNIHKAVAENAMRECVTYAQLCEVLE